LRVLCKETPKTGDFSEKKPSRRTFRKGVKENLNISQENLKAVLEGMKGVTSESGGTAYSTFAGFNIEVAGKTGTAQVGNKTNGWFAGFAPYDNPEIAIVVVVENVTHGGYTAEVAIDIFAEYFGMNASQIVESQEAIPSVQVVR
jgi:penicillin-binding protein 2